VLGSGSRSLWGDLGLAKDLSHWHWRLLVSLRLAGVALGTMLDPSSHCVDSSITGMIVADSECTPGGGRRPELAVRPGHRRSEAPGLGSASMHRQSGLWQEPGLRKRAPGSCQCPRLPAPLMWG
jgi:hypothetical protein